jgi:hypothetical protein
LAGHIGGQAFGLGPERVGLIYGSCDAFVGA